MLFGNRKPKPGGLLGTLAMSEGQPDRLAMFDQAPQQPAMQAPMQASMQRYTQPEQPKGPGFFDQGGFGRHLAGTLGDSLMQMSGLNPIYAPMMQERRALQQRQQMMQQQATMAAAQAEAERRANMEDWRYKYDYEQQHKSPPKPGSFEWYQTASEADRKQFDQYNPIIIDGPDGRYAVPRSSYQAVAASQSDWDNAKPLEAQGQGGGVGGGTGNFQVNAKATGYQSYNSGSYGPLEVAAGKEFGVPPEMLWRVRTKGERSNSNQVSEAGARSVYQIIPETRNAIIRKYGFDPWSSPENAARGAAIVLRDMKRTYGNWDDAMTGYHGGNDTRNWGPRTRAYRQRTRTNKGN